MATQSLAAAKIKQQMAKPNMAQRKATSKAIDKSLTRLKSRTKTANGAATATEEQAASIGIDPTRVPANGNVPIQGAVPVNPATGMPHFRVGKAKPILESLVVNGVPTPLVQPAHTFLTQAADTIAQRAAQRDNTGGNGERSMAATVAAFNAIEGTTLTTRQGWAFMQLLKITRAASSARNGKHDADSYIDGAAYAGLAGEEASREECKRRTTHQIVIGGEQP